MSVSGTFSSYREGKQTPHWWSYTNLYFIHITKFNKSNLERNTKLFSSLIALFLPFSYLKSILLNGLDGILKEDLGGQRVAVVDNRLPV